MPDGRSLEDDAVDCLIKAIWDHNHKRIRPDQLDIAASDERVGAQDGAAWLTILKLACAGLATLDYRPGRPDRDKADTLLNAALSDSVVYLIDLATPAAPAGGLGLLALGVAAGAALGGLIGRFAVGRRS